MQILEVQWDFFVHSCCIHACQLCFTFRDFQGSQGLKIYADGDRWSHDKYNFTVKRAVCDLMLLHITRNFLAEVSQDEDIPLCKQAASAATPSLPKSRLEPIPACWIEVTCRMCLCRSGLEVLSQDGWWNGIFTKIFPTNAFDIERKTQNIYIYIYLFIYIFFSYFSGNPEIIYI